MKIIANVIAGVATIIIVALVTLNFTVPLVSVYTFACFLFMANNIIEHIKDKKMPIVTEWIAYIAVILSTIFLSTSMYYRSVTCLVLALIAYVVFFVCMYLRKKQK